MKAHREAQTVLGNELENGADVFVLEDGVKAGIGGVSQVGKAKKEGGS